VWRRVIASVACNRLAHGEVRLNGDVLQDKANAFAQQTSLGAITGVESKHSDLARVSRPEAFEDL